MPDPAYLTRDELHALLTSEFSLVVEHMASHASSTYFLRRVESHPARSTRAVRVFFDDQRQPVRIQLCASSDDNHTVLLHQPFDPYNLRNALHKEIELIEKRIASLLHPKQADNGV